MQQIRKVKKIIQKLQRVAKSIIELINKIKQLPNLVLIIIFIIVLGFSGWYNYNGEKFIFSNKNRFDKITLRTLPNLQEKSTLFNHKYENETKVQYYARVMSVAFSPKTETEATIFASGDNRGYIKLWKLINHPSSESTKKTGCDNSKEEEVCSKSLKVGDFNNVVWSIAFSPNNDYDYLASGSSDGKIRFWSNCWDEQHWDKQPSPVEIDHGQPVGRIAFSPDGKTLASGSIDGTLKLWDITNINEQPQEKKAHDKAINSIVFNQEGTILASGSIDGTIKLWRVGDLNSPITTQANTRDLSGIMALTFFNFKNIGNRKSEEYLASASWDGTINLWNSQLWDSKKRTDGTEIKPIKTLEGHKEIWFLISSPYTDNHLNNNPILVSGSKDGIIKLWNPLNTTPVRTLRSHPYTVYSLAFSHDGTKLASASADETVKLWEVKARTYTGWNPPPIIRFW